MDYAAAVNEEIRDLFAAGADIVQIDEPYMQAQPEKAREFGVTALNHALDGVTGTTVVHLCFGYAAIVRERPSAYSFLTELAQCQVHQVSIETAQSSSTVQCYQDCQERRSFWACSISRPTRQRPRKS